MERRTASLAFIVFAIACGGDPGPQTPTRPPPADVLAMPIRVNPSGGDDTFCPAFEQGLARSNLTVSTDPSQPADANITCNVFVSEDTGFLRLEVNGQRKMHFNVRVEVRSASGQLIDQFVAEYGGYRRSPPDEDVVAKTVLAFAYSQRISALARASKNARAAGTAPTTTAVATVDQPPPPRNPNDQRDDQDWFAIETVKCKIPSRVEACDPVRRYLQRHPNGAHVQEASDLLSAAQPALEKLQKDDVAWQKSNHNECARARNSDACVGVEAYEVQFPSGAHIDDAHRLLRSAGMEK